MSISHPLHCIGYASGIAAAQSSCCMGPLVLQPIFTGEIAQLPNLVWEDMLYAPQSEPKAAALPAVTAISEELANYTQRWVTDNEQFLVLGGDHTSAIGTWSGAAYGLAERGDLGLIWIDAHMDSHTPETTITHNLHGMPLATLLGQGYTSLTQLLDARPKLKPQNLCLIGVRDFEAPEKELLQRLGVHIVFMEEVRKIGINVVLEQAIARVTQHTAGYGISLDIDSIDPSDAPGTGLPVPEGISGQALCESFKQLRNDKGLLGIEITEFDPRFDQDHKTERLIVELATTVFDSTPFN